MQDNIDRDQSRVLKLSIKYVYNGSYNDIQNEDMVITAWKYSTWLTNNYVGEIRIPLHKIITENLVRSDVIKVKHEGKKKNSLRISYRCYFQEIWNYQLKFCDFKVTNLQHNNGKPYSPAVTFSIPGVGSINTDTKKQDKNPLWEVIKGDIRFKGALYELEDNDLAITLHDKSGLKKGPVCVNRIPLKGISTQGSVRVPVKVSLSSGSGPKSEVRGTRGTLGEAKKSIGGGANKDDDLLAMDFYYTYLEGRIVIPEKPKYFQKGDGLILRAGGRYLVIQVGKIENLIPPETVGIVNTFVTVQWGNQKSSTRTIFDNYAPTFNEEMYFKISLDKQPDDPKFYEEVKNYLKSRSEITIYVWLDLQNGSYENIGYANCSLSELNGMLGEEKSFYDFENKKEVSYKCRVAEVKKRVVSSMVDSTNTHITFSFYLMPDYAPQKIDFAELTKVEGDKMDPIVFKAIREGTGSEPYKTHKEFLQDTFHGELELFRDSNFNFIFAVDQCNITRFLPTYVDTFNVDYTPPKSDDYALSHVLTAKEIFSMVNNIPFIEDYKKPNLIASPDFLLSQNKGTLTDHVILLACMMMGCNFETQAEVGKLKELADTFGKDMVSFENRIFVCIGTNKFSRKRELWLMTYSRDMTSVTMWDVKESMTYQLKGRINTNDEENVKSLKMYIKFDPTKDAEGTLQEMLAKMIKVDEEEEVKAQDNFEESEGSINFDLDKLLPEQDLEAIVDVEMKKKIYRYTAEEDENGNAGGFDFMAMRDKQGAKGKRNNTNNMNAIHDFYVEGKRVTSPDLLPWGTIELIFNHKNIWANIQHQNPSKIMYEIHNPSQWRPFLSVWNRKAEIPWLNKVGAFHSISNLEAPMSTEDIRRIETMILKDIKFTINCQRSGLNLESKFRSPKDKITVLLQDYLKLMHIFETCKEPSDEIMKQGEQVAQKIKELIPRDYRFCYLPLRFSIADTERIRSIIAENFSDFFMKVPDPCMFSFACKLFPFPNKISSLRVIIAHISKIALSEFAEEEDTAADLDDENKWDIGKVTNVDLGQEDFYDETK